MTFALTAVSRAKNEGRDLAGPSPFMFLQKGRTHTHIHIREKGSVRRWKTDVDRVGHYI